MDNESSVALEMKDGMKGWGGLHSEDFPIGVADVWGDRLGGDECWCKQRAKL